MSATIGDTNATLFGVTETDRGQQIRRRRRALGLTQADLARETELSLTTIRNLERGQGATRTARLITVTLDRLEAGMEPQPTVSSNGDTGAAALIKATLVIGEPDNMHADNFEGALRVQYWVRPAWMTEARFDEVVKEAEQARNRRQDDEL